MGGVVDRTAHRRHAMPVKQSSEVAGRFEQFFGGRFVEQRQLVPRIAEKEKKEKYNLVRNQRGEEITQQRVSRQLAAFKN